MSLRKKRKKSSRYRGTHTHGRGGKKKARGSGHRGGFGMSGTGKRADQRKTLVLTFDKEYFGKSGLKAKKKKYKIINVGNIDKLADGKKEVNLSGYKILGQGEIKSALNITADYASESAIEKIKKAGGKIILKSEEKKEKEVVEEKSEKISDKKETKKVKKSSLGKTSEKNR